MCMTANSQLIDSIVDDLVSRQECFSAWDVTRAAKQRGATENHFQMKSAVHARWFDLQNNGYTRSLVPTPTGDTWLYHPVGADTQPYIDRVNKGQAGTTLHSPNTLPSPNTSPAAPVATSASLTSVTPSLSIGQKLAVAATGTSLKTATTDIDGRLGIYQDQLEEIGAKPFSNVSIFIPKTGAIIIQNSRSATSTNGKPSIVYTVNKDGRIRLSRHVLTQAFGTHIAQYKIRTDKADKAIRVETC